jgi:hypothetical protein
MSDDYSPFGLAQSFGIPSSTPTPTAGAAEQLPFGVFSSLGLMASTLSAVAAANADKRNNGA